MIIKLTATGIIPEADEPAEIEESELGEEEPLCDEEEAWQSIERDSHLWWLAGAIARHYENAGLVKKTDPFGSEFESEFAPGIETEQNHAEATPDEVTTGGDLAAASSEAAAPTSHAALEGTSSSGLTSDFGSEFGSDFGAGTSAGLASSSSGGDGPSGAPSTGGTSSGASKT